MENNQTTTTYEQDVSYILRKNRNIRKKIAECYVSNYYHKGLCNNCESNIMCKMIIK